VTQHARRPFYAQLADLTAALLRAEEQRLRRSESAAGRKP
jgi:TorA maturation chaperone TorD